VSEDNAELFGDEAAPVTTTEAISPEAPKGPARDESGRFAPADKGETLPAPAPVETSAPPAPKPDLPSVPLTVVLEEREKRQRIEREAEELRRAIAAMQQKQAPQIPDAIEDQQGFAQYLLQQQQAQLDQMEAAFSERMARKEYGSEFADQALEAAKSAGIVGMFTRGPDRWERMCEWFKQQKAVQEIGPDPSAYRAKIEAEIRAQIMAEMQASPAAPSRQAPPRSLAAAAGASGSPPVSGHPLFD
jgi:hypothetical protein